MTKEAHALSIRESVLAEIGSLKDKTELIFYFNNFMMRLPSSTGIDHVGRGVTDQAKIDKQNSQRFVESYMYNGRTEEEAIADLRERGTSERYIQSTRGSFRADVEEAITNSNVDRARLLAHVDRYYDLAASWDEEEKRDEMMELLLPVWIALREKGYSDDDLRG